MNTPDNPHASAINSQQSSAQWSAVLAMSLCVFALIASEFMPVSLLTPIADDLSVSEGFAGYGIAISGAFAVLTSLFLTRIAGNTDRRTLLLGLTGLMCVSALLVGIAPNYAVYMAGRALIGVVIGGFWSLSAAVAIRLVPPESVAKALAIFNGGNALATVVAAPLGSYLGDLMGWRGAFYCLIPVVAATFVWLWFSLPSMPARAPEQGRGITSLLRNPLVLTGMVATGLFFMGQFTLFTYIRPFLETVTGVNVSTLSAVLLVIGISGLAGTVVIGHTLGAGLYRILTGIPILMAALAVSLILLGESVTAVFILLALWGFVATAAPVAWWAWLAQTLPEDAEAGGGLMVAIIQMSIALGSTAGGILFDGGGHTVTFIASALLLVTAALMAGVTGMSAQTQKS